MCNHPLLDKLDLCVMGSHCNDCVSMQGPPGPDGGPGDIGPNGLQGATGPSGSPGTKGAVVSI